MIPIVDDKKSLVPVFYNLIESKLVNRIQKILRRSKIKKDGRDVFLSVQLRTFLSDLLNNDNEKLKKLIGVAPSNLDILVRYIRRFCPQFLNKSHDDSKILFNIFVSHGYENIDKMNFTINLNLDTCPYCNRNYIFSIKKAGGIKPEIDHFYCKSIFPFLACSFYNLIPSCQSCNGFGGKGEINSLEEKLINPYLLTNNHFRFSFKIKNIAVINPLCGKSDVEVYLKNSISGHNLAFNLEDLYSLHHDHAIELIIKKRVKYSDKYRLYLNSYKGLQFSKSEIDRMILGNYSLEKEQNKRPLSKLYQDIGRELGLI